MVSNSSVGTANVSGDATNEVLSALTVFDVSDRTQIEVTGADRCRFLHSFTTNDISRLKPGQGCETFITNIKGRIVAHLFVFCTQDSLWLDGTPGQVDAIMGHLKKFLLIDDVQLISRGSEFGELFVTGDLAAQLLQMEDAAVLQHVSREISGQPLSIRRVDLLGVSGFLLSMPRAQLETSRRSLSALGVREGSVELFEALRIKTGFPLFGVDITEENLAQEAARTRQCISFNKGCYLGQETIARLDALGHTNQEVRRLRLETEIVPACGTVVFDASGVNEVGIITSAAKDVAIDLGTNAATVNAIGMLKRSAFPAGTSVRLKLTDHVVTGKVC